MITSSAPSLNNPPRSPRTITYTLALLAVVFIGSDLLYRIITDVFAFMEVFCGLPMALTGNDDSDTLARVLDIMSQGAFIGFSALIVGSILASYHRIAFGQHTFQDHPALRAMKVVGLVIGLSCVGMPIPVGIVAWATM